MNEIKELLNSAPGETTANIGAIEGEGLAAPAPSKNVLKMDSWGRRRGLDIAHQWRSLDGADYDPHIVADAHESLFNPEPVLEDRPEDQERSAWWKQLMQSPEYLSLRQETCLDQAICAMASRPIYDQWVNYAKRQPQGQKGRCPGGDDEPVKNTVDRIRSTRMAIKGAREAADMALAVAAGLGLGERSQLCQSELARYFKLVKDSEFLRRIMDMAGRMRSRCRSLQMTKTRCQRGEITGIELGGDIDRLLPFEMAKTAGVVPELQDLALYHLATRRALCFRHKRVVHQKSGPIVVCVDESGSMSGQKIITAKALAMTMAWLASHQGRWIALVGFGTASQMTRLVIKPGRSSPDDLLDWLTHQFNGGTELDVPLRHVPNDLWKEFCDEGAQPGKTDVIVITDAEVLCPDDMTKSYLEWAKKSTVRTYGLILEQSSPGCLGQVCDKYWCLPSLDLNSEAVESVLSI